jgi:hypothetical protein
MREQLVDIGGRSDPGDNSGVSLDLIWGVSAISKAIGRTERQTFYLLEMGKLPATKLGERWVASRGGLHKFFSSLLEGAA